MDGAHATLFEGGQDLERAEACAGAERVGRQGGLIVARTAIYRDHPPVVGKDIPIRPGHPASDASTLARVALPIDGGVSVVRVNAG